MTLRAIQPRHIARATGPRVPAAGLARRATRTTRTVSRFEHFLFETRDLTRGATPSSHPICASYESQEPVQPVDPVDPVDPVEPAAQAPSLVAKIQAWLKQNREKSRLVRQKLLSYGPAAVLAYGLFDGVSYSIAFAIAFIGYEAKTGLNPTANVADIIRICILMWAGNNVTRPFRLAGAAALAPAVDRVMETLQKKLNLPNKLYSFFILTALVAAVCLSGVGALIFSRWIQG
jgi:hypothetical protein